MQTKINFISADKLIDVLKKPDILCDFSDKDKSIFFRKIADLLQIAEYEQDVIIRGGCATGLTFSGFEREGVSAQAIFEKRDTSYTENPDIAVIIPTIYRSLDFLARAVESCMSNTYKKFKIYITSDGAESPSQFPECIEKGISSGLIELNSLSHRGVYPKDPGKKWFIAGRDPLNYMIARANKKIICRLDDDDWYLENHFETIVAGYHALKGHGVVYTEPLTDSGSKPYTHPESWKKLGGSNQFFSCNVGYCGDVLNDFWYENQCDIPGDWHTYLQLIKKHKFIKIPTCTSVHTAETQRRAVT